MSPGSTQKSPKLEEEQFVCRYQLQHDLNKIIMVADCKECQGDSNLNNQSCLTAILNALCQEYNVDSVVLSHYVETKYADDSMQMLMKMVEIVHDLEQMGIREPYKEYFAKDPKLSSSLKNQQKNTCQKCELKPEKVFAGLKKNFLRDLSGFYIELDNVIKKVVANENEACDRCMKATKSDLLYLFKKLEDLRAYVIYKGFQIVI